LGKVRRRSARSLITFLLKCIFSCERIFGFLFHRTVECDADRTFQRDSRKFKVDIN
jgi:hypothetical protein